MAGTDILAALRSIVGERFVLTDPADTDSYSLDDAGIRRGHPMAGVRPGSTAEVASVMKACAAAGVPVVPQGGNTGLVCGTVADPDAVIVSLSRMNRILSLNPEDFTMAVEAGCVLEDIRNAADAKSLLFPLSLGAQGSCQIGGNLATNVGGINTLLYGTARDNVLGIEVVLPDGRIWDGMRAVTKDNTGYSLRNLFIGSEGTLGIITGAVLKLHPRPHTRETAFCGLDDLDQALPLLDRARRISGDSVAAFELISRAGIEQSIAYLDNLSDPLEAPHPWYALIDFVTTSPGMPLRRTFETFLEEAFTEGVIVDAVIAESLEQTRTLWRLREELPEAQKRDAASFKHDVSVPVRHVPAFIRRATDAVIAAMPGIRPAPFGHMGDGNIHFNTMQPRDMDRETFESHHVEMNFIVHDIAVGMGGSFSAEHGVGSLKTEDLARYHAGVELELMRKIKAALDPQGLMNPRTMFG